MTKQEEYKKSVSDFFGLAPERRTSIDVEASGVQAGVDKIWSIGMSDGLNEKEVFINTGEQAQAELMDPKNKIFDVEGYFDPYKKAIKDNRTVPIEKGLSEVMEQAVEKDMILIQNHSYENRMIGAEISDEMGEQLGKRIEGVQKSRFGTTKVLFRPPEVRKIAGQIDLELAGLADAETKVSRGRQVKKISSKYDEMIRSYSKSVMQTEKATVVDLMDITKAVYAKAATKGLMEPSMINTGVSVDFLSKAMMGKAERHTAAADSTTQIKVFDRLGELYQELSSSDSDNLLSPSSRELLDRIKDAQPEEAKRTFFSGVRNTLEEIENEGTTRVTQLNRTKMSEHTIDGEKHKIREKDYAGTHLETDPDAAIDNVERRTNSMHRGDTRINAKGMSSYVKSVQGGEPQGQRAKRSEKIHKKNVDDILLGNAKEAVDTKEKYALGSSFSERIGETFDRVRGLARDNPKRAGALALLGGAGLMRMMSSNNDEEEQDLSDRRRRTTQDTNASAMRSFSRPNSYHGSGLYEWDNAVGHGSYG